MGRRAFRTPVEVPSPEVTLTARNVRAVIDECFRPSFDGRVGVEVEWLVVACDDPGLFDGYAMVKDVEAVSGVRLGPGTLYATLSRLEARGLIEGLPAEDRRRPYRITGAGLELLRGRLQRMESISRTGLERLARA